LGKFVPVKTFTLQGKENRSWNDTTGVSRDFAGFQERSIEFFDIHSTLNKKGQVRDPINPRHGIVQAEKYLAGKITGDPHLR
jgi:hypothetical protein